MERGDEGQEEHVCNGKHVAAGELSRRMPAPVHLRLSFRGIRKGYEQIQ